MDRPTRFDSFAIHLLTELDAQDQYGRGDKDRKRVSNMIVLCAQGDATFQCCDESRY
jgi:hypothetical protein